MRPTVRPLLIAALLLSLAACGNDHKNERRLTLLFTTDEHSHLFAIAPEKDDFPLPSTPGDGSLKGGVARRVTILDAERGRASSRGVDSMTVSLGDFSQGTLVNAAFLQTSPDLFLLRKMKYDAVALGNHEFEMGPAALAGAIGIAAQRLGADGLPPLVLTNLMLGDVPAGQTKTLLTGAVAPSRVITLPSGLKVGVVSWLGASAGTSAAAAAPVRFWPASATTTDAELAAIAAQVQPAIDDLRNNQHVDFVVALGHGGIGPVLRLMPNGTTAPAPGDDEVIASSLRGLDVVLSGHSHKRPDEPHLVLDAEGHYVPVVQPAPYGEEIGRVELLSEDGGRPTLDAGQTAFIPVDDRTLPTTDATIRTELATTMTVIESGFAPATLSIAGITPAAGAPGSGSTYYQDVCQTTFTSRGLGGGESNVMNLDTDAMLATANTVAGPTTVALQAYGSIRTDLVPGKTGGISFADLYRAVPNGVDPGTGTAGWPLVRALIPTVALRAALEGTLLQSMFDGDFFVGVSGLRVEYDTTRAPFPATASPPQPFAPGWITRMALVNSTTGAETKLLYDVTQAGVGGTHFVNINPATDVQPVTTSLYVASFASAFGVTLLDPANPTQPITPTNAIIHWAAGTPGTAAPTPPGQVLVFPTNGVGTAVKDHQALVKYVYAQCQANSGNLPTRYDDAAPEGKVPRRMVNCVNDPAACAH